MTDLFFDAKWYGFSRMTAYEGLSRVLMKMNKPLDALKSSEYGKARVFAEHVAKRSADVRLDVPEDILRRETELTHRISTLKQQREPAYTDDNKARIANLEPQVADIEKEFAAHVSMLREKYPLFAATRYPQPMDLVQTAVKPDEWVLSYQMTDPALLIYLTHGKEMVKGLLKPIPRKEIDDLIRKFRSPLEVTDPDALKDRHGGRSLPWWPSYT